MVRTKSEVTYRSLLAIRDFRYLLPAEILSVIGDQLGRIALSILVFGRTGSPALTGLTYGLTFVPTLFGSIALAGFADHHVRRNVMIFCDLVRAVLIGCVAIPGMPLWLLCVLVAGATSFNGPFRAAQQALLPEVLHERVYVLGISLRSVSVQSSQVAGFAVGGVTVGLLSPEGALLFDALTFLASAVLLLRVRPRPVHPSADERPMSMNGLRRGMATIGQDKRMLVLLMVTGLNLFTIFPEGLAAPYVAELGLPHYAVAMILASMPLGGALGALLFGRLVPDSMRTRVLGPIAIGSGLVLIPLFLPIGLWPSMVLFALTGACANTSSMYATALIAQLAPAQRRGRISGTNSAVTQTVNGLGPMFAGVIAGVLAPSTTIAVAGVAGTLLAIGISVAWTAQVNTGQATAPVPEGA